jgi:hypothetical protein
MTHDTMVWAPGGEPFQDRGMRYRFPVRMGVQENINRQRRGCLICQAYDPPNQWLARPVRMSPVIEGFMSRVSIHAFSITEVEWEGATRIGHEHSTNSSGTHNSPW